MSSSKSFLAAQTEWLVTALDPESKLDDVTKFEAAEEWELVIRILVVYIVAFAVITRWMAGRNQVDLRNFLKAWNTILSLCSAGMLAVVTETIQMLLRDGGLHSCICDLEQLRTREFQGWITYFRHLKLLELGDSVMVALEKKPVTYLHIHHRISMLCVAHAAVFHLPVTRLIVASNLVINFLMYACLALEDSGWMFKAFLKISGRLQALLRAITLGSYFYGFLMKYNETSCDVPDFLLICGGIMDLLYFVVFLRSWNASHGEERGVVKID